MTARVRTARVFQRGKRCGNSEHPSSSRRRKAASPSQAPTKLMDLLYAIALVDPRVAAALLEAIRAGTKKDAHKRSLGREPCVKIGLAFMSASPSPVRARKPSRLAGQTPGSARNRVTEPDEHVLPPSAAGE